MKPKAIHAMRQLALDELERVPRSDHALTIDRDFPEEIANQLSKMGHGSQSA